VVAPPGVAVVTGGGRGIGLEVCRQLGERGWTVALGARSAGKAERAAADLAGNGLDVRACVLDVADQASVRAAAAWAEAELGGCDVLVNNAAIHYDTGQRAASADLGIVREALETNVLGAWACVQAFLPLLRASAHARLVLVSSGAGSHGDPGFGLPTNGGVAASYGISKAAVNALMTKLAADPANAGVLVNAVCPGLTATAPGMEAMGARPVAEGAASVAWGALLPDDGPRGGFFRDGVPVPW
jgi:NAD(P)-dependent dehydrogenase (short-subunit alcohol dehydrogenase family)